MPVNVTALFPPSMLWTCPLPTAPLAASTNLYLLSVHAGMHVLQKCLDKEIAFDGSCSIPTCYSIGRLFVF